MKYWGINPPFMLKIKSKAIVTIGSTTNPTTDLKHIKLEKIRELRQFFTQVLIQSLGELVQGWWNLQPLLENPPLPLDSDHLWPFHEPMQIPLWRQSPSYAKLLWPLLKERVNNLLLEKQSKITIQIKHRLQSAFKVIYWKCTGFFFVCPAGLTPLLGACNIKTITSKITELNQQPIPL